MKSLKFIILLIFCLKGLSVFGQVQGIEKLTRCVEKSGKSFPQEKVYLHMDNNSYFLGDTIWFKAYVTRTDTKMPSDLSKILYVELLTPDGYLVERQQIQLENDTTGYGNIVLADSLYGGYYELRAYTRWMLNFGRTEPGKIPLENIYRDYFFNTDAMKDYFVDYEKLYSRVFPVYDKPQNPGEYYTDMTVRPMLRYFKSKSEKTELKLSFYPEGGHILDHTECRVAYELTDKEMRKISTPISIKNKKGEIIAHTTPSFSGRGTFILPANREKESYRAELSYEGNLYSFDLPESEEEGCALYLTQKDSLLTVTIRHYNIPDNKELGIHILNSGILRVQTVCRLQQGQPLAITVPLKQLPTGVNTLTVFDERGHIYAERMFFVRHEELMNNKLQIEGLKQEYDAFEPIRMTLSVTENSPAYLSLAVRDASTMVTSYDNGNILTEMLLSSELKGFIENPGYYFEKDDSTRRSELDLLMMVQGWKRYKWTELAGTTPFQLNYLPEKYQTLSGRIYKDYGAERNATYDRRDVLKKYLSLKNTDPEKAESYLKDKYYTIDKPVVVHADYAQDTLIVETEQITENGYFYMTTPRFFGQCVLFLSANDSVKEKSNTPQKNKGLKRWIANKMERLNGFANEEAFPAYYVKRDLFFPLHSKPYSYYQENTPGEIFMPYSLDNPEMLRSLPEINIRSNKGGLRRINRSKPALIINAYKGFNNALDLGVVTSPRYYQESLDETKNMLQHMVFAYTGDFGVNEVPPVSIEFNNRSKSVNWGGEGLLESYRYLKYVKEFRLYSDFAPRERGNSKYSGAAIPKVTFNVIQYDEQTKRQTYRDRYIILDGFAECDGFYNPDYSKKPLPGTKDYRRTLYWNPDIRIKPGETKTLTFYNNAKKTTLSVEAEGITSKGTLLSRQIGKK